MKTKFEILVDKEYDNIIYIEYDQEEYGKVIGFNYMCGTGDNEVEMNIFKRDYMKADPVLMELYNMLIRTFPSTLSNKQAITRAINISCGLESIGYKKPDEVGGEL